MPDDEQTLPQEALQEVPDGEPVQTDNGDDSQQDSEILPDWPEDAA